ncbi:MAG: LapA family protein [Actinomycetota bacterium]
MADDTSSDSGTAAGDTGSRRTIVNLVLLGLVVAGFGAFVVQNTDSAEVSWLLFDGDAALWLVMLASAVAGAVATLLTGVLLRRRRSE